jgi:heptosyltransferase I
LAVTGFMADNSGLIVGMDSPPHNICIFRLSALGDVTHTVPVVRALQAAWPDCRITWIIGKLEHRLLGALPGVEFIVYDKRGGLEAFKGLRRALQGRRFDVLLHMQVALRANLLSRLVKAPLRLGWDAARSRDQHQLFINQRIATVPLQHQVQGFLEFPRALGIEIAEPDWRLPTSAADHAWAEQQLPGEQATLVISPCSSHRLRNWSVARYATVADHAASALKMRVVLSGGPSDLERDTAAAIEQAMRQRAINLVGKDTLSQSMALLQRASLLLSPDSGPVHIANAMGTAVIGLYAATWARRSGPYNSLQLTVDRYPEAARRFRGKEPEQLRWGHRIEEPGVMDLVTVDDVIEKLELASS